MLFAFSKFVEYLVEPGNFLVSVLTAGALLLAAGWRRSGGWLVAIATAAIVTLTVFPIGEWALVPLENRFPAVALPARIDGIVVLGGAVRIETTVAHGKPALNDMAPRITEALALSRRYPGVPVVLSGGNPAVFNTEPSEAQITRALLISLGLDPNRILTDDRSRNTHENAVDAKEVAKPVPGQVWVLVTSANHMPRAMGCFRAAGWDMVPDPVDYETSDSWFGLFFDRDAVALDTALHEWLGLVAYRLLGWTDALFPAPNSSASSR